MMISIIISNRLFEQDEGIFRKIITHYLSYLMVELGNPPTYENAQKIVEKTPIQIAFYSQEETWQTSSELPPLAMLESHVWKQGKNYQFGKFRRIFFVIIELTKAKLVFATQPHQKYFFSNELLFIPLLILLPGILIGAFFAIRWVFQPVKLLTQAAEKVGNGNFEHQIQINRKDEFQILADSFNDMVERIRSMMYTKEQLLLDVSHEMRSPVTRMKIALEMLPDSTLKTNLQDDVQEIDIMISEILETARLREDKILFKKKRIHLEAILRQCQQEFENSVPAIHWPQLEKITLPPLLLNEEKIKIVLRNLLQNAIKYSVQEDQPIEISVEEQEKQIVVKIVDHGVGIPKNEIPFIFEPFYRVDKSRSKQTGGYGLGLHLCQNIMKAHQGQIQIESQQGQGTTLWLYFLK